MADLLWNPLFPTTLVLFSLRTCRNTLFFQNEKNGQECNARNLLKIALLLGPPCASQPGTAVRSTGLGWQLGSLYQPFFIYAV